MGYEGILREEKMRHKEKEVELKAGDTITEKELKERGWKYEMHLSSGIYAYQKDNLYMFWDRSTSKIFSINEKK